MLLSWSILFAGCSGSGGSTYPGSNTAAASNGTSTSNNGGGTSPASGFTPALVSGNTTMPIKHIVIIMQENRSFDSYFGTFPGADGIPMQNGQPTVALPNGKGMLIFPYHDTDDFVDSSHSSDSAVRDVDGGKMDGFITEFLANPNPSGPGSATGGTGTGREVMAWHDAREIPNYWTYAQNFVLHDHMFQPVETWSFPTHLAMVSAWSATCTDLKNPESCKSDLNPNAPGAQMYLPYTDITYLLHKHGVSWAYYVATGTEPDTDNGRVAIPTRAMNATTPGIWNPLLLFQDVQDDSETGNVQSFDNLLTAARNGTLPAVSWVIPSLENSEHAPYPIADGQAYVTNIINTIMQGPNWNSTAIFVVWDDWGGLYDHVPPPNVDALGYGLRVPSLLISPYARRGYVDHQVLSFDAYLKFIEDVFLNGERIDPTTDGRPDSRPNVRENYAGLGDLMNDFDFTQSPRAPLVLPTHPAPGPASIPDSKAATLPRGVSNRQAPPEPQTLTQNGLYPNTGGKEKECNTLSPSRLCTKIPERNSKKSCNLFVNLV